ncbi:hypothetical protein METBIDRAFT_78253 [Metschnikowia bicuspidata var. bicuspidata NRRL YB-4993]|uniref:Nucleolar pre-ribosomal-associated protein 1 C-terminal domain-containing protein n=1 Tax=Metschnikowia bicuspidata var. bicuspidata NRRL YB-4993 TaxID=869754 RepID=A0A1A0HB28_9ASCO|nr:hypothetical protein METBIDRAFT_78253 [Metschnikowia bicuspidata var. bicuspidata NRRL YB-4993]OBA21216.1 hypothetical protein METBIDRAFT_78253 [Metschnikowia bicuspidata var. bicuspidata NRRL YB-4993]
MNKTRTKNYSSLGLDTGTIADLQSASVIGIYEDLSPVVSFVQNNGLTKSFSNILYFSAANDLGQLTRTSQQLSVVFDVINYVLGDKSPSANLPIKLALLEEVTHLNDAYVMVISNLKVVYKIYGMRKPAVVVSITKILQCLVEYNNSNIFSQFTESFDFDHTAVHNILVPTRDDFEKKIIDEKSMRWAFVEFWISLCSASNPTLRKTLLTNFKIMNNFWKYMEMEKFESITRILNFLDQYVCSESTFKRATKCRILNENFLYNVRSLFSLVKSENDRQSDNDDVFDFTDFKTTFLKFMNVLVSDTEKGITYPENEFGSPLVVNSVSFNINNKLIYTLLTAMKPWDSYTQLQFVMQILNNNHELLLPYMHWIVSNSGGYHEPTLSSYWIGHTLLYCEILKSRHLPLKAEFVSLSPLSKGALSECIAFPSDLVKQLGLQLILLQLQKLLNAKSVDQSLKDFVLSNLPSHTAILPLLTHENKLLKLTATLIVAAQEELAPKSSSSATVCVVTKELSVLNLNSKNSDSFDLILLDLYLSIQSSNELKWWNKLPGENSFFTSLLKFSNLPLLRHKILKILQKLTKSTLVFNEDNLIESPLLVLIETTALFHDSPQFNKIWACLDETISRAVSSPYKYLDKSHKRYNDISIFLVVLFEQMNYVPGLASETSLFGWLNQLAIGMLTIGECSNGITKAAADSGIKISLNYSKFQEVGQIISNYDFARALSVLNALIDMKKATSEIFNLMTNMGDFLASADISRRSFISYVTSPSRWRFLTRLGEQSITDHEILAICLYCELLRTIKIDLEGSEIRHFILKQAATALSKKNQALLRKFIPFLSVGQLKELAMGLINEMVVLEACKLLLEKDIDFDANITFLMSINSPTVHEVLPRLTLNAEHVEMVINNPNFFYLLEIPSSVLRECLLKAENLPDRLLYQISAAYPEIAEKFQSRIIRLALSMDEWVNSLKIFTAYNSLFDQDHVVDLVFRRQESQTKKAMNSVFIGLVESIIKSLTSVPDQINLWLHRAMLYVTKRFAESDTLSDSFEKFLHSLQNLFVSQKRLSRLVPVKILDAQLQVLLASHLWSSQSKVLEYVNHVIISVDPKTIDSEKLLQLFINNDKNPLRNLPNSKNSSTRFQASLVIYSLFNLNENASSTMTLQENILALYLGSQRADDLLLKDVLQKIEKNITQTWVSQITNWDYQNEMSQEELDIVGEERLFIRDSSSFVVALNKTFVKRTTESNFSDQQIPQEKNYQNFEAFFHKCPSGTHQETTYDPEFLMLLIINNEELVKETEEGFRFNLTKLVDSGLLRFVITSLSFNRVREIAKIVLMGVLKTLCDETVTYRDKSIMKVFVSSILHSTKILDHAVPLVWYIAGSLCSILTTPGHYLYEQVHRYVLSTPAFKPNSIPLFNLLASNAKTDDLVEEDDYYKSVTWLVVQMAEGIKTSEDIKLLKSRDVLEWMFNLYNSKYASNRLRANILNFLYSIQRVGPDGTDMVTTKFAGLSTLEVIKRSAHANRFYGLQERLNVDQLTLRMGLQNRQKRLANWTLGNLGSSVKRVHLAK